MKRNWISLFLVLLVFLTGSLTACGKAKTTHVEMPAHTVMGSSIVIDSDLSAITKAYYEATDLIANVVIDRFFTAENKPTFITFAFSSDMRLNADDKDKLVQLFQDTYSGTCEIDANGNRPYDTQTEGVTINYDSIAKHQVSDCDLTLTIGVRYSQNTYYYCCDFNFEKKQYVLFRYEMLYKDIDLT